MSENETDPGEELQVPKANARDRWHQALKAAISTVPVAGGAAAELFAAVFMPSLERRRDRFFESLLEELRRLQATDADFSAERLAEDDAFVTAVQNAARVAVGTHLKEKHDALRNAVINVAKGEAPEDSTTAIFISLIERLTPMHLALLRFLDGGREVRELIHSNIMARLSQDPVDAFAECNEHFKGIGYEMRDLLLNDLVAAGLITWREDDATGRVRYVNPGDSFTTAIGKRFIAFISGQQ